MRLYILSSINYKLVPSPSAGCVRLLWTQVSFIMCTTNILLIPARLWYSVSCSEKSHGRSFPRKKKVSRESHELLQLHARWCFFLNVIYMQRLSNDVGPGSAFKDRQCLDFCRDANRSEGCGPHGAEKSDESTDRKDERERDITCMVHGVGRCRGGCQPQMCTGACLRDDIKWWNNIWCCKVTNQVLLPSPQHNVYPPRPFICCVWIKNVCSFIIWIETTVFPISHSLLTFCQK